jgi:8-oxo-dGTP pyrophosphatase MutT (NUDIX family)
MLLNLRDSSKQFYPDLWDLVGGTLEPGERPEECMRREILEETGEEVGAVEWLADFDVPLDDGGFALLHLYLGEIDKPASDLVLGEGQAHQFFAANQLDSVEIVPGTRAALKAYVELRRSGQNQSRGDEALPYPNQLDLVAAMARYYESDRKLGPSPR